MSRHSIQSSPIAKEEHGVNKCCQVSFDTTKDECYIHVDASFYDWWEQIEPRTEEVPPICADRVQAMDTLNIERGLIIKQLRKQKKEVQVLQKAKKTEEISRWVKETRLEQELHRTSLELAECKNALQDVLKEFNRYKAQHEPEMEEPEWLAEMLEEKVEEN